MTYLDENQSEVRNASYYRRQVKQLQIERDEAIRLLKDLSYALDSAFISSWQTTDKWQQQLDAALEYLEGK